MHCIVYSPLGADRNAHTTGGVDVTAMSSTIIFAPLGRKSCMEVPINDDDQSNEIRMEFEVVISGDENDQQTQVANRVSTLTITRGSHGESGASWV